MKTPTEPFFVGPRYHRRADSDRPLNVTAYITYKRQERAVDEYLRGVFLTRAILCGLAFGALLIGAAVLGTIVGRWLP